MSHLIHGDKTDWIPRMEVILSDGPDKKFDPFDRLAISFVLECETHEEIDFCTKNLTSKGGRSGY